jgi:hypothetical protein
VSIEGGMSGTQKRFVCEKCDKVFFAWRPDTAPGAKIKCYFCKHEMVDDAAARPPASPPPAAAPSPPPAEEKEPAPS